MAAHYNTVKPKEQQPCVSENRIKEAILDTDPEIRAEGNQIFLLRHLWLTSSG